MKKKILYDDWLKDDLIKKAGIVRLFLLQNT